MKIELFGTELLVDGARLRLVTEVPPPAPTPSEYDPLALGAKGDGVTDDSAAFQSALSAGPVVVNKPAFFYRITRKLSVRYSVRGVNLPEIRMAGADGTYGKAIFEILNVTTPLTISGLHLNGGWDEVGTFGEASHLISVRGSAHVIITGNTLEKSYGDNIFLERLPAAPWTNSSDIAITRNTMRTPHRCNVAVVAAHGVLIDSNDISKSNGYVTSVDLEPDNDSSMEVYDVTVRNNTVHMPGVFAMAYNPMLDHVAVHDAFIEWNTGSAAKIYTAEFSPGPIQNIVVQNNTLT